MVAVGSRFALLATLCTVAVLSFNPLLVSAAVIDARHSSQPAAFERDRHGVKQQVIPLPNKFKKANFEASTRDPLVEHGRVHKGKGKERERSVEYLPADQVIRVVQLPVRPYKRHHDDDCPKKVVVNGDRNHLHLVCHDWHDHDHDKVVVNGNHDHVRTRRNLLRRSPRHSRPMVQPRNDPAAPNFKPEAVLGTVEVVGSDGSSGQDKAFGEFVVENRNDGYDVGVSSTNQTMFYLVGASSLINGVQLPTGILGSLPLPDIGSLPIGSLPVGPGSLPVGPGSLPVGPGSLPVGPGQVPVGPGQLPVGPGSLPSPGQAPNPGQAPSPGQPSIPGQLPVPGQYPFPTAPGQVRVTLQAKLANRSEWSCCSYEKNPDGPRPMTMEDCKPPGSDDDRISQIFLFEPGTGTLQPVYNGTHSNSTSTNSTSSNATSADASREQAPDGNQSVKMIWRPFAQGGGARTAPEVQTVTVTVTSAASTSSGGLREASSTTGVSSAAESWSISAAPVASSTGVNGLKVEVAPNASWAPSVRKGAVL